MKAEKMRNKSRMQIWSNEVKRTGWIDGARCRIVEAEVGSDEGSQFVEGCAPVERKPREEFDGGTIGSAGHEESYRDNDGMDR